MGDKEDGVFHAGTSHRRAPLTIRPHAYLSVGQAHNPLTAVQVLAAVAYAEGLVSVATPRHPPRRPSPPAPWHLQKM